MKILVILKMRLIMKIGANLGHQEMKPLVPLKMKMTRKGLFGEGRI